MKFKGKFKSSFSKLGALLTGAVMYFAILPQALADQDPLTRCKNFKAQFGGVFDWVPDKYCTLSGIGIYAIDLLLGLAGTAAVIFIILGGFWYLTSGGGEEQAEKGRKTLVNAVIGLIVVVLAATIVRIIANTITSSN